LPLRQPPGFVSRTSSAKPASTSSSGIHNVEPDEVSQKERVTSQRTLELDFLKPIGIIHEHGEFSENMAKVLPPVGSCYAASQCPVVPVPIRTSGELLIGSAI